MSNAATARSDLPESPDVTAVIDANRLESALSVLGALVDECRLELAGDGLHVRAVDPANVAAVSVDLPASSFAEYDAGGETIGVDIEPFAEVVGLADPGSTVRLALDAERRRLHLLVGGLSYTLGLIDPEAIREPLDPAEMEYDCPATLALPGSEVGRIVTAADMVSNHLTLGVDTEDGSFYAAASGDTDDVTLTFPSAELPAFDPAAAESLFSLDYLRELARPIPAGTEVAMELGTEQPVVLSFDVGEAGSATYLLSPRMTN